MIKMRIYNTSVDTDNLIDELSTLLSYVEDHVMDAQTKKSVLFYIYCICSESTLLEGNLEVY